MVKKGSKRTLHTGNTIRQYNRHPVLRQYQKYGCMVVENDIGRRDTKAAKVMKDVLSVLPTKADGVELSLNKQRRWELPSYMKNKVELESDNKDVHLTVLEHRMSVPIFRPIDEWETCTSYYSNLGTVRECVSNTEMNIQSAKQGHREEDHLGKLERRQFKKMKRLSTSPDVVDDEEFSLPSYECRIAYGAKTNGKLYMELATKGFAQTSKKNRNHTSGCSKRYLSRHKYTHDDLDLYSDDDVCDYEVEENTTPQSAPTLRLSDFMDSPSITSGKSTPRKKLETSDYIVV